ncbi:MAG: hypothetical protein ACM3JI_01595, partial [Anaerolineae bacterium]
HESEPQEKSEPALHRAGLQIPLLTSSIFTFIENTLEQNRKEFAAVRRELYAYAFGRPRDPADILIDILSLI